MIWFLELIRNVVVVLPVTLTKVKTSRCLTPSSFNPLTSISIIRSPYPNLGSRQVRELFVPRTEGSVSTLNDREVVNIHLTTLTKTKTKTLLGVPCSDIS